MRGFFLAPIRTGESHVEILEPREVHRRRRPQERIAPLAANACATSRGETETTAAEYKNAKMIDRSYRRFLVEFRMSSTAKADATSAPEHFHQGVGWTAFLAVCWPVTPLLALVQERRPPQMARAERFDEVCFLLICRPPRSAGRFGGSTSSSPSSIANSRRTTPAIPGRRSRPVAVWRRPPRPKQSSGYAVGPAAPAFRPTGRASIAAKKRETAARAGASAAIRPAINHFFTHRRP